MSEEVQGKLFEIARGACKITWNDNETDTRILEIAENAAAALRHKLGMKEEQEQRFCDPGLTRILFENYCLYYWNDMLNEFEKNYRSEILTERHRYEVENDSEDQQLQ